MGDFVREIAKGGASVVMVCSRTSNIANVASRVVRMKRGRVVGESTNATPSGSASGSDSFRIAYDDDDYDGNDVKEVTSARSGEGSARDFADARRQTVARKQQKLQELRSQS